MNLSDRIRRIIQENGLKQKEFAQSIHVTESYISKLLRDESGVSRYTASLIEEKYGYRAEWILDGAEPLKVHAEEKDLAPLQRSLIADIEQMDESELVAVRGFISSLGEYKKTLGIG